MILLVVFILVVATVPLLGGKLSRLATIDLRWPGLMLGATVVQAAITQLDLGDPSWMSDAAHVASYLLAGGFVWANRRVPWLWLAGVGGALNFIVIAVNGGVMPASSDALVSAGRTGADGAFTNSALIVDARLWFLGDVFAIPASWPLANVFSVGDVVLLVGGSLVVHRVSGSRLSGPFRRDDSVTPQAGVGTRRRASLLRRNRDFRRLWLAGASSDMGDWTYSLAVIAVLALQGASAAVFATLFAVQMVASSTVGILATSILDRADRIRILVVVNLVQAVTVSTLLLPATPGVPHLVVVGALLGGLSALVRPATMSSIPNLVDEEDLVTANGFVAAGFNVAVSLGPLVGAGAVAAFGARPAFLINVASFVLSATLTVRIRTRHIPLDVAAPGRWFATATAGLRHVARQPPLRHIMVLMVFVVLGASIRAPVEPGFVVDDLGGSAGAIGALASLWGLGMATGSAVAITIARRWPLEKVLVTSIAILAGCVVSAPVSASLAAVAVLWLIAGSANALGSVAYDSLLQQRTPDGLRGRVFGAAEAVLDGTYLVGALLGGVIGTLLSASAAVGVAGVAVVAAAVYGVLVFLRRPPDVPAPKAGSRTAGLVMAPHADVVESP